MILIKICVNFSKNKKEYKSGLGGIDNASQKWVVVLWCMLPPVFDLILWNWKRFSCCDIFAYTNNNRESMNNCNNDLLKLLLLTNSSIDNTMVIQNH